MQQKLLVKATGDLIWNKIADKITSIGKSKEKEKPEEIYIPPEKKKIIDDLKLLWIIIILLCKNGISEGYNFTRKNF